MNNNLYIKIYVHMEIEHARVESTTIDREAAGQIDAQIVKHCVHFCHVFQNENVDGI